MKLMLSRLFEALKSVPLNKGTTALSIILSIYALYQTCQNLKIAQQSAQDSKRSADIAQEALALQQQQYKDFKEIEALRRIEDAEKQRKDIELTEQQIFALKTQAAALNRGVRNTEVSQRPYFVVKDFGFHRLGKKDSYLWSLKIQNYGDRPAYSTMTQFYFFNDKFQLTGRDTVELTVLAYKDLVVSNEIVPFINGVKFTSLTKKDILTIGNSYAAIIISYYDPLLRKRINLTDDIQAFKWTKKSESQLNYRVNGEDYYFDYNRCNDTEKRKILEVLKSITQK